MYFIKITKMLFLNFVVINFSLEGVLLVTYKFLFADNFVVNFANEYWPIIYRIVLPVAINTYNPWLCNLANHFFSKVSFTEIFP